MEISRDNYELYFLDFLDGKLSEEEAGKLHSFLDFNPDLRAELEGLEEMRLEPAGVSFHQKESLKQQEERISLPESFEHYCIASMENDLNPVEESMVREMILEDDSLAQTYQFIRRLKLEPDPSLKYPFTSLLKRRSIRQRRIWYIIPPAAAVIAMMIALPLLRSPGEKEALPENGFQAAADQTEVSASAETINQGTERPVDTEREKVIDPDEIEFNAGNVEKVSASDAGKVNVSNAEEFIARGQDAAPVYTAESDPLLSRIPSIEAGILQNSNTVIAMNRLEAGSQQLRASYLPPVETRDESQVLIHSLWKLADAGLQMLDQGTPEDYTLERRFDGNGRTKRFTLETPVFGFSAPLRQNDNP